MRIDLTSKEVKIIASSLSRAAKGKILEINRPGNDPEVETPDQFTKASYVQDMIQDENGFVYIEDGVLKDIYIQMFHEIGLQFGVIKGDEVFWHNVIGDNTLATIADIRRYIEIRVPELVAVAA